MEQLVHGQHELQGHLLHGQHEHWVKLLDGTVVQGRVNIASTQLGYVSAIAKPYLKAAGSANKSIDVSSAHQPNAELKQSFISSSYLYASLAVSEQ